MNTFSSAITTIVVVIAGVVTLWVGTDKGMAWTTESARRLAVFEKPIPLPTFTLRDENDQLITLAELNQDIVLIDFIYTQCLTTCVEMGASFRDLQAQLVSRELHDKVQLLSLSFDPAHDGAAELSAYLARFSAIESQWKAARFVNNDELNDTLKRLEVIVIPDPKVGFIHNSAIYLVHQQQVVGIYDFDNPHRLLDAVQQQISRG